MAKELLPDVTVVRDRDHKTISGGSIATVYRYARFGYVCQLFDFLNQILSQLLFCKIRNIFCSYFESDPLPSWDQLYITTISNVNAIKEKKN